MFWKSARYRKIYRTISKMWFVELWLYLNYLLVVFTRHTGLQWLSCRMDLTPTVGRSGHSGCSGPT